MANVIKVKSNLPDKSRVAIWERHPDHPKTEKFPDGGEIFISDDKEHEVAETAKVKRFIRDGILVKVETPLITQATDFVRGKREKATE